jgi:hypothetical protein
LHLRGSELASTLLKHFRGGATEAIMPWCLFPEDVKRVGSSVPAPLTMRRGTKPQHFPKWPAAIIASIVVIALSGAINGASHAEDANISNRRNSERTSFTNDEIKDGFFKIAFDAAGSVTASSSHPGRSAWRAGSLPPEARGYGAARRRTPRLAPHSGSSLEHALNEQGCMLSSIGTRYVVNGVVGV